ncbi:hypothetical protein WJX81_005052 [Elliptochloris bilobata]|uniref:U-box domain-containing protein n=1 Tax=Elliptochloris bilobata TaxID=381761 RepID=A0AAW1QCK2_9CHLO
MAESYAHTPEATAAGKLVCDATAEGAAPPHAEALPSELPPGSLYLAPDAAYLAAGGVQLNGSVDCGASSGASSSSGPVVLPAGLKYSPEVLDLCEVAFVECTAQDSQFPARFEGSEAVRSSFTASLIQLGAAAQPASSSIRPRTAARQGVPPRSLLMQTAMLSRLGSRMPDNESATAVVPAASRTGVARYNAVVLRGRRKQARAERERRVAAMEIVYMSGLMSSLQALEEAAVAAAVAAADIPPALSFLQRAVVACADQGDDEVPREESVMAWRACVTAMFRGAAELGTLHEKLAVVERDAADAEREELKHAAGSGDPAALPGAAAPTSLLGPLNATATITASVNAALAQRSTRGGAGVPPADAVPAPPERTMAELRGDVARALGVMETQYLKLCMAHSVSSKAMQEFMVGYAEVEMMRVADMFGEADPTAKSFAAVAGQVKNIRKRDFQHVENAQYFYDKIKARADKALGDGYGPDVNPEALKKELLICLRVCEVWHAENQVMRELQWYSGVPTLLEEMRRKLSTIRAAIDKRRKEAAEAFDKSQQERAAQLQAQREAAVVALMRSEASQREAAAAAAAAAERKRAKRARQRQQKAEQQAAAAAAAAEAAATATAAGPAEASVSRAAAASAEPTPGTQSFGEDAAPTRDQTLAAEASPAGKKAPGTQKSAVNGAREGTAPGAAAGAGRAASAEAAALKGATAATAAGVAAAAAPAPAPAPGGKAKAPAPAPADPAAVVAQLSALLQLRADLVELCCCPITQELMHEPVTAADGFCYERAALENWLRRRPVSPMTNAPLPHARLTPVPRLADIAARLRSSGTGG